MLVKGATDASFTRIARYVCPWYEFEYYWFKITTASPMGPMSEATELYLSFLDKLYLHIIWVMVSLLLSHWNLINPISAVLTHWGRVTHICVFNLTIISSDNGLSPGRRQTIIRTNAGILLIGPLGTNFSEIFFGIQVFSFKKMHVNMSSAKWRPFCLGFNVLTVFDRRWWCYTVTPSAKCQPHLNNAKFYEFCQLEILQS